MSAGAHPDCRGARRGKTPPRGNFAVLAARPERADNAQKE